LGECSLSGRQESRGHDLRAGAAARDAPAAMASKVRFRSLPARRQKKTARLYSAARAAREISPSQVTVFSSSGGPSAHATQRRSRCPRCGPPRRGSRAQFRGRIEQQPPACGDKASHVSTVKRVACAVPHPGGGATRQGRSTRHDKAGGQARTGPGLRGAVAVVTSTRAARRTWSRLHRACTDMGGGEAASKRTHRQSHLELATCPGSLRRCGSHHA
jgi:hypothetical protein